MSDYEARYFHDADSLSLALVAVGAVSSGLVHLGGNITAVETIWPGRIGLRCWIQCDDGGEGTRAPDRDAADLWIGWFSNDDEEPDWYTCPNDADAADTISELPYRMGLLAGNVYHCSTCGHWSDDHLLTSVPPGACDAEGCDCLSSTKD